MKNYIFVGLGGLIGAVVRVSIGHLPNLLGSQANFNLLLANALGCFILSFFTNIVLNIEVSPSLKLATSTGFCGALTTFSSLCKESMHLFTHYSFDSALGYIALSICCGLGSIYLGEWLVHKLFNPMPEKVHSS